MSNNFKKTNIIILIFLFIFIVTCFQIIEPYLDSIIIAIMFAIIFSPIHNKIEKLLKNKHNLAATITTAMLVLIVIIPLTLFITSLIFQCIQTFETFESILRSGSLTNTFMNNSIVIKVQNIFQSLLPKLEKYFPTLNLNNFNLDKELLRLTKVIINFLISQSTNIAGNLAIVTVKFFIMIFIFFFIIRDKNSIIEYFRHLSPLTKSQEDLILSKISSVTKSTFLVTFIVAAFQGLLGGISFAIAGVSGIFWGTAMAFASFIPIVGSALIWIPIIIYLCIKGTWGYAIFVFIWCGLASTLDSYVRTILMQLFNAKNETQHNPADSSMLLIFFSIVGGVGYFGLLGLVYGPVIMGLTIVFIEIYRSEFEEFLKIQETI